MVCPLCSIPKNETLLYEDNNVYLVPTKDTKGHKVRVMVATKNHTTQPTFIEQTKAYAVLLNYMNNLMQDQDWFIVSNQHATIPEHFHIVACDVPLEDENDPLFTKTQKLHFPLVEKRVLIGIPALNEEKTLQKIITEAKRHGDVLVVDDGSKDNTLLISVKTGAKVSKHITNKGYGTSIHNIFQYAKKENYDVLVTIDSDGQHQPSEIPNFIQALKNSDVVVGNRFMGNNTTPNYRKLGIKTISKLAGINDAQCGFRAYNKKAIQTITGNIFETKMGASIEILKVSQNNNLKIIEIPCTVSYNKTEHSQNPLSHGLDVIRALFWSIIWDKPLKTLLPTGLLFLITAMITGIQTITFTFNSTQSY